MAKRVLVGSLAVFALVAAVLWVPWATEKRTVAASTPVPPPLYGITRAPLGPGQRACMKQVTLDPLSQVGQIGADTGGKPGPALDIAASGPGYWARARVPAGYRDTAALRFRITPPK